MTAISEETATKEWRCFHCGDVFTDHRCAEAHFGPNEDSKPACLIKAGAEGSLVRALRNAERDCAEMNHLLHDESSEAYRLYAAQGSRHHEQLRAAEEAGYECGLADGRAMLSTSQQEGDDWKAVGPEVFVGTTFETREEKTKRQEGDTELVEALRSPKTWCCIFEFEGQMRHGTTDAPYKAADCIEALNALVASRNEEIGRLREALQRSADAMTCRDDDNAHYCPNCDNSLYAARDDARQSLSNGERG